MWKNLQQLVAPDPVDETVPLGVDRLPGRLSPATEDPMHLHKNDLMESSAPTGWEEDDLDVGGDFDDAVIQDSVDAPVTTNDGWNDDDIPLDDPWDSPVVDSEAIAVPHIHVVEDDPETKCMVSGWDDDQIFADDDPDVRSISKGVLNGALISGAEEKIPLQPLLLNPPVAHQQVITALQIQHEQDLQKQYSIIDQKSSIIQSLERNCWQLQQEYDQRCRDLQNEMETLASELISTAQERDMLLSSLHINVTTIQQLQDQIEQAGDSQNERHQQETLALQEQISQSLQDVQDLQQTLQLAQSENQQLLNQLQSAKASGLAADEEGRVIIDNLHQESDTLQQEIQTIKSAFALEQNLILERYIEERDALSRQLEAVCSENDSLRVQVVTLQSAPTTQPHDDAQWGEMTQRVMQLQQERDGLLSSIEEEKHSLMKQQREELFRIQAQMKSIEEECQSWQAKCNDFEQQKEMELQDAVQNVQVVMEKKLMRLQLECDRLRQLVIQLEQELASYKKSVEEHEHYLDEQSKWYDDEIQQLRQEVDTLNSQQRSGMNFSLEEEVVSLLTQSELLKTELQIRDDQLTQLKEECHRLQSVVSLPSLQQPIELEIVRSRLEAVLCERDALVVENEELLVQFGYTKQKMDSADEYILSLQEDIKSLHAQLETVDFEVSGVGSSERVLRNSELDRQIKFLTSQKNELDRKCCEQEKQIEDFNRLQNTHLNGIEDYSEFQAKINILEAQCKAKDHLIENKDNQIFTLMRKVDSSGMDVMESEDVSSYCELVLRLEAKCKSLQMELDSVKSQLEATEGALNAKEQLYSIQSAVYDLESSVPFRGEVSRFVQESEGHIRDLEKELNIKSEIVEELQGSVINLKFQLDDHDARRENTLEFSKKDEEMELLKEQLESVQAKLRSKEEELSRVLATETGISAYNLSKEVDSLRSNIVSVARALQRSETNRADAISRLVSEREAHVLQLRSMSEKLKRFYSSLTYGRV